MIALLLTESVVLPEPIAPNGLADGLYFFEGQVYQSLGGAAWALIIDPVAIIELPNEDTVIQPGKPRLMTIQADTVSESFALKAMAMCLKRPIDTLKVLSEGKS